MSYPRFTKLKFQRQEIMATYRISSTETPGRRRTHYTPAHHLIFSMSLKEKFDKAVKIIQELPKEGPYQPSNDEKLKFYGLFKQITVGKVNTKRPGMLDFIGKAKWDAWNALGDMTPEQAMEQYVEEYEKMEEKMKELGLVSE